MDGERRFTEEEIARIFQTAATSPESAPAGGASSADGLTLAELQAIGREVGLAPARVAEAAAALDRHHVVPARRSNLGMPISAGHVVDLPRFPNDREWEILAAELRRTFHASGEERSGNAVREWRNGNLHACIEPTDAGYQLRLGTVKSDAVGVNALGILAVVMAVVALVAGSANPTAAVALALLGAGALAWNAIRLRSWAEERDEQMEHIAERALTLLRPPALEEGEG
ncbi:MAG TPA: hypothetical protein VFQ38_19170 [Longimicrobiales bacterium]|nr:hypothetical protein [Longimicrobiales bacterium]